MNSILCNQGYIINKKYSNFLKPTHKVNILKAKIYKLPNKIKINEISFSSKIKVTEKNAKYFKFQNGWIKKNDVKPISYKEKNPVVKITSTYEKCFIDQEMISQAIF